MGALRNALTILVGKSLKKHLLENCDERIILRYEYCISPNVRRLPIFPMRKLERKVSLTILNMSFSSKVCKIKGVKSIL
jgi:hypothetical protein